MSDTGRRTKSVVGACKRFYGSLNTALRIYGPARSWMRYSYESFDEHPYQPRVAQKVVGLAFLSVVAAWEEFAEQLFLGYMADASTPGGYSPTLSLGPCRNRSHAVHVLGAVGGGDSSRLFRWNDWTWVVHVANVYFRRGEPFSLLNETIQSRLRDAQAVRNRVAHNSPKARKQFKKCANSLLGEASDKALPRGFSPGEFLATAAAAGQFPPFTIYSAEDHAWGDYFESFVSMYFEAGNILAPYEEL